MAIDSPTVYDYMSEYRAVEERLAAIVAASNGEDAVPACPAWRVLDVLAHLAGVCEDWGTRHLDAYASDEWTASQVQRFAGRSCSEIVRAWEQAMGPFSRIDISVLGGPPARWAFGDAVIHEADICGAIGVGRVPDDAVLLGLQGTLARWTQEVLGPARLPPLRIRTSEGDDWELGTGESDAVLVDVPRYELFRALAGRRSPDQLREWAWSADPGPYIQAGLPYPFHWASAPLED